MAWMFIQTLSATLRTSVFFVVLYMPSANRNSSREVCRYCEVQRINRLVFVDILSEVSDILKLDLSKCSGHAADGASSMQGHHKGFSALMSKESPKQVHAWCYARVLNLVLADTTQSLGADHCLHSRMILLFFFACHTKG